jgi:hypothetical protein
LKSHGSDKLLDTDYPPGVLFTHENPELRAPAAAGPAIGARRFRLHRPGREARKIANRVSPAPMLLYSKSSAATMLSARLGEQTTHIDGPARGEDGYPMRGEPVAEGEGEFRPSNHACISGLFRQFGDPA